MNRPDAINCRQVRDLLLPTLPGLDQELPAAVADHVSHCDPCAAELTRREEMAGLLRQLSRPQPGPGLRSFAQVRERFEAREEPALERDAARLRPLLRHLRRVPAPASLRSRVLPGRRGATLRLVRRVGALAAAAGLLVMGLLSFDRPGDHRDHLAQGRPLAPVVEIVHVDALHQPALDVRQRAVIAQRLIPWAPALSGEEAR